MANTENTTSGPGSFGIDNIVKDLRTARQASLERRLRRNNPPKLPSRKVLQTIVDGLTAALFPNRLGQPGLKGEGLDYFVGYTLEIALRDLYRQVKLELNFTTDTGSASRPEDEQAMLLTSQFGGRLASIREILDTDTMAAYEGDPAARSIDEVLVCYPGVTAMIHHRLAHELHTLGLPLIARMIAEIAHSATGIDIHPGATIGHSFFIDHGTGVVIGETAVIGNRVRLYQAVTLGAKSFPTDADGLLIKGAPRHPILEDEVVIYAGATVLGRITIGKGSVIGGNVWLTHTVPPGSQITQANTKASTETNPQKV
ncbi:MAG: serine O-acetyltransferase EpsC [Pseudomonadota bacterium]